MPKGISRSIPPAWGDRGSHGSLIKRHLGALTGLPKVFLNKGPLRRAGSLRPQALGPGVHLYFITGKYKDEQNGLE